MKNKLVTVVTLTYKNFSGIFKTIDSVLCQDYDDIEYIIADDGSENFPQVEIEDYISKHKRKNIKKILVLHASNNRGTVKNINEAYDRALGTILMPLSGNDIFADSDIISKIVKVFEDKNCELLVTRRIAYDSKEKIEFYIPNDRELKKISKLDTNQKQYEAFVCDEFYNMASGSVLYMTKECYLKHGRFDQHFLLWEDGPFLTSYTYKNRIETDYSIVSIRYELGGVSNAGINQKMISDILKYNDGKRIEHLNELPLNKRKKVLYVNRRYSTISKIEILFLYMCHPLIIYKKILYNFHFRK